MHASGMSASAESTPVPVSGEGSPFLRRVEEFLAKHPEVTPTRLGIAVKKDPRFVKDLRAGRSARESTITKVDAWMVDYARRKGGAAALAEEAERAQQALDTAIAKAEAASPNVAKLREVAARCQAAAERAARRVEDSLPKTPPKPGRGGRRAERAA